MKKYGVLLWAALISVGYFLVLPIMTSPCIPYFNQNVMICENRWTWLGGYHVVNQKLHSLFNVSYDEWHNYIEYHYWHLGLLILTSLAVGIATYLVIRSLRWPLRKTLHNKVFKKYLVVAFTTLLVLVLLNISALVIANKKGRVTVGPIFDPKNAKIQSGEVTEFGVATEPYGCGYNTKDLCFPYSSVDFYPSGSEGATNPEYVSNPNAVIKEIAGVVNSFSGNSVTLKTSSGRLFTIIFPVEAVDWWNNVRSPMYGNQQVGIGTTLQVMYLEAPAQKSTTVKANQIFLSRIILSTSGPKDNPIFYSNPY